MVYIELVILLIITAILLYKWSIAKYNVLSERGIPHESPRPLLGNLSFKLLMGKGSFMKFLIEKHLQFKDTNVYGFYSLREAAIVIRDTDLIKTIAIKDFEHFSNHKSTLPDDDSILSKSLVALRDKRWKITRGCLSPAFTGSKMRILFELINECSMEAIKYLKAEIEKTTDNQLDLEIKDFFNRFTNDAIASVAFGIKVDSFTHKNNEFFTCGKNLTTFPTKVIIKIILFGVMPKLMKLLRIPLFDATQIGYFKNLVMNAIGYRQKHKIIRPDMIQLLMEAKQQFDNNVEEDFKFDDDDILGQCFVFFLGGFETVSTCLCFTAHELAMNPEVQQNLYEEILQTNDELQGKPLSYDALKNMKYMDMVLSESLRMWPPAVATDRECSQDYVLKDEQGNAVINLKKGDQCFIPIAGLHHDPENFPNPSAFDPMRFSDENKHNIKQFTYLPFGVGPRSCIANRMALMETKSMIYHLLLNFKIVPTERTSKDMINSIQGFQMKPKDLFWLKLIPREK